MSIRRIPTSEAKSTADRRFRPSAALWTVARERGKDVKTDCGVFPMSFCMAPRLLLPFLRQDGRDLHGNTGYVEHDGGRSWQRR